MRRYRILCAAGAAVFLLSVVALAQIGSSTITGRVIDSTGAVVPGATVLVVNTGTNFQYNATTNQDGLYRVQSLQPGPYRVSISATGFKTLVRENIDLRTGDVLAVDGSLEVGSLTEQVEVTAAAALLATETSATGTVAEGKFLYELPTFQRFTNSTLNYVPGMTAQGYTWGETLGGFHVAGARGTAGFFGDGVSGQSPESQTATVKIPLNSIAEVQVLTTSLPAEYGHSAAGLISVVTKTGTNDYHGVAALFGRTRRMQHRRFFDFYRTSQPMPGYPAGRNAFTIFPDFNFSGPVWIPKVYNGKGKTFFFASYQKFIEKMEAQQFYGSVPTAEMKSGNFNFGGVGQAIYDPGSTRRDSSGAWVRDVLPNKTVPLSRIDPVAQKVLALDPWNTANWTSTPTTTGPGDNYMWVEKTNSIKPDMSLRVDHQFNPNFRILGSLTRNSNPGYGRPTRWHLPEFDTTGYGRGTGQGQWASSNYMLGNTWVVSATTVNDVRMGYYRRNDWTWSPTYGVDPAKVLGIPNLSTEMMPTLNTGYGFNNSGNRNNVKENISFRDDVTRLSGKHAFKMGYELMRLRQNQWTIPADANGTFNFIDANGVLANGSAMPNTGNTFAGFLMGYVRSATFSRNLASWLPRSAIHSFYFQDDWKATPQLTLNLGVRYSNESPFNTRWKQLSQWDPDAIDDATGKKGGVTHPTSPLNRRDNNNFQPRIGVAWHPLRRWVFRGGFGVNTIDVNFPGGQFEEYSVQVDQSMPTGDPRPVYLISQGPKPVVPVIRPDGTSPYQGTTYSGRNSSRYNPDLHNAYQLNWNQSIQYELTSNYLIEASYQGSAGIGLTENFPLNTLPLDWAQGNRTLNLALNSSFQNYRPYTHFGTLTLRNANMGHSTYHAGTIELEKRYSSGLNFITFYTFSKAIDSATGGVAPIQNLSLNKARAAYDRTQRFVASVTYELPMGRGKRFFNQGGLMDKLFGGYQVVWIQTFESGNPLTFSFASSPYLYLPTAMGDRRPNLNGKIRLRDNWRDFGDRFHSADMNSVWTDMNVFSYPAEFSIGNAGRSIADGPGMRWSQVSAQKSMRISERVNFEIRWEMQNPLKTYNFNNPTTSVDFKNPQTFGKITNESSLSSSGGPAVMHLTFRLTF